MSITCEPSTEVAPSVEVADLDQAIAAVRAAGVPIDDARLSADLTVLLARLASLEAIVGERLAAFHARGIAKQDGAGSTTSWVVAKTNMSGGAASALLSTGKRLARYPELAAAMAAGRATATHLRMLDRAVSGLPEHLVAPAVDFLTPLASEHDAVLFGAMCQRTRETLIPELTDDEIADLESDQWLDVSDYDGGLKIDGLLRGINAEAFKSALDRFSKVTSDDTRTAKQRRADALGQMSRVAAGAPASGLAPVHVTVICDLVTLQRAAAKAWKDGPTFASWLPASEADLVHGAHGERTGAPLSWRELIAAVTSGEVRRLVLGPESEIIDLGRAHRFFSRAQRIAIRRGDGRCLAVGCRNPFVEYDHKIGWAEGGGTDANNGQPLCGHHNRLRTQGWETQARPDGRLRFIKPLNWKLTPKRRRRPRIE